jgi:hypothetical protein
LSYTTEATPIGEFTSSVTMTTGSQNEITTDYSKAWEMPLEALSEINVGNYK